MSSAVEPSARRAVRATRGCAALLVLLACPAAEPEPVDPEPFVIATIDGWVRVTDPAADVFAAMRPADAPPCDETGYGLEQLGLSFEILTGLCDYLTVAQPIIEPLSPGDVVTIRMWHDELQAPTPTEGYAGVALNGVIGWETTVPIPSPYGTMGGEFTVGHDVAAGTMMQYHVHNHGINSWNLLDIEAKAGP